MAYYLTSCTRHYHTFHVTFVQDHNNIITSVHVECVNNGILSIIIGIMAEGGYGTIKRENGYSM